MQTRRVRFVQIKPRSPWQWILVVPLLAVALVLAAVLFVVALVVGLFTALFGGRRPQVVVQRRDQPRAGPKVIDAEYVIDDDDGSPAAGR